MKKLLVVVAAIVLVASVIAALIASFWDRDAVSASAARSWPGEMGTLNSIVDRHPPVQPNEASAKLIALAKALPKTEAVDEFVRRESLRGELIIGEPPPLPDVAAIRDLLLRESIVWERRTDEEIGDAATTELRALQLTAARALAASALSKARRNDSSAWEDLHAVWKLARSLDGRPQMMMQTAALSMARTINALAWKMPLPAPSWLADLHQRDGLQPLLEAYQHQTASYWADGSQLFPTKFLAASVEHDRAIAAELVNVTACDVNTRVNKLGSDLTSVWRRAFRYRAEREASANALRVREGKPIETASRCSDGVWTFDGTTLRFSREVSTAAPDAPMPLVLRLKQ